ncbi:MAG: four helix bundle protein [Candidatus Parcubacteria bacterium]|nr:four helix bundle protein [Candidatus Parcubacteria bacterium]
MFYGKGENIRERCLKFTVEIIKLTASLPKNSAGFEIGKQIIRSGGSIGANLSEANCSRSSKEFVSTVNISLKEAEETLWWLNVILNSRLIDAKEVEPLLNECKEIIKILVTIIKNTKNNDSEK